MMLSDVSIKRPVFATMINLVIVVFGIFSLPKLAIEQYPNIDFPVVTVLVEWPGADPQSVEDQILEPVERAVNGISGIEIVNSTAFPSAALIVLRFKLETNSNQAVQDVRDKVSAVLGELPQDAKKPIIQRFELGSEPVINLALTGNGMGIGELSKIADDDLRPRIQRIAGVAKVGLVGDRKREAHVLLDRNRLSSYGFTALDVLNSIKAQNLNVPAGKLENGEQYFPIRVQNKAKTAYELGQLPVISARASVAKISDVATVEDTLAQEETAAFVDQKPTILLSVFKESGGNTNAIADNLKIVVEKIRRDLPKGVELTLVTDNSKHIRASIDAVKLDLVVGAILAILIVFLFLRDWRATLISAIALPTAVIGTFAFLRYMGFTLNMMSTLGLSLSIGILIDDAIVVIENIYRHLAMGKSPFFAAKDATSEIGLAVLATTMTIGAVFVPVAFMEGIIGRFFYQFGLTVSFAVLISLFVAFTLTPMLSSRLLKTHHEHDAHSSWIERFLLQIDQAYRRLLVFCLYRRGYTLIFGVGMFVLSIFMLAFIPVSFFAKEDQSCFSVSMTLPENTALPVTKKKTLEAAQKLKAYPGVKEVISSIGVSSDKNPGLATLSVNLVPVNERNYSQYELMDRVREDLKPFAKVNGIGFEVNAKSDGGGRSQNVQLVFQSNERDKLVAFTDEVALLLKKDKDMADVKTTKSKDKAEYEVNLRANLASDLRLNTMDVALGTRVLFEGEKAGQFEDETGRYDIRVKLSPKDRVAPQDISSVTFGTYKNQQVSLGSVSSIEKANAPSSIERYNGQQQITVLANYLGHDLNSVLNQVDQYVKTHAPAGVTLSLEGEGEIMKKSIASMMTALLLAVLLIYMILCAQYERYLAPFVIMMALPLSLTGAFGALLVTGQFISVYTMIGVILLMGLVTKNGILLIDFTLQKMAEGKSVDDALMEAGPVRLRPILMTTLAAGFGMLPIAIGHGEGGEAKSSMGIAVIGGLLVSTVLTLVVVPCLFSLMEKFRTRLQS